MLMDNMALRTAAMQGHCFVHLPSTHQCSPSCALLKQLAGQVMDSTLELAGKLPELQCLKTGYSRISGAGIMHLQQLTTLTSLTLQVASWAWEWLHSLCFTAGQVCSSHTVSAYSMFWSNLGACAKEVERACCTVCWTVSSLFPFR